MHTNLSDGRKRKISYKRTLQENKNTTKLTDWRYVLLQHRDIANVGG